MIYAPFLFFFIFVFFVVAAFLFALVQIGIIGYAFNKIGVAPEYMFSFLLFSIIGAFINIPVAKLPQDHVHRQQVISVYGWRHIIPASPARSQTVVAVNVGGALVPTTLSIYLLTVTPSPGNALFATFLMTVIINRLARPVPGLGIAVPTLIPPALAALTAMIIAPTNSAAVAYIAGTMGSLIGADLLNLGKIRNLGAPIVSIGGAGTFDGIFMTGILAVLLASI